VKNAQYNIRVKLLDVVIIVVVVVVVFSHSADQIKKTEMGRACSMYWERRGAYRILVGKREGRRLLGRTRRR
jgi:hypothetical protein